MVNYFLIKHRDGISAGSMAEARLEKQQVPGQPLWPDRTKSVIMNVDRTLIVEAERDTTPINYKLLDFRKGTMQLYEYFLTVKNVYVSLYKTTCHSF